MKENGKKRIEFSRNPCELFLCVENWHQPDAWEIPQSWRQDAEALVKIESMRKLYYFGKVMISSPGIFTPTFHSIWN